MKFRVSKTSDEEYQEEIEICSLEELISFIEKNRRIIIDYNYEIEIYDDYRE